MTSTWRSESGVLGLTPLEDQQVAGLIMWVPGGAVHALAALFYLLRWFNEPRATRNLTHDAPPAVGGSLIESPVRPPL